MWVSIQEDHEQVSVTTLEGRWGINGVPIRVVEEERVESGEGLGRKVLATESTDSPEGHL